MSAAAQGRNSEGCFSLRFNKEMDVRDYTAGKAWKLAKQRGILEAGFALFSERGIESVTMPEIAQASGVARATLYRYFSTKLDLVVAIGTWKWDEYIQQRSISLPQEDRALMTGAELLRFYLDAFLDLYRNHKDILRFNYNFNSYLQCEAGSMAQRAPYLRLLDNLVGRFHKVYQCGMEDGTLRTDLSEETMFSCAFHILMAAVTRYAVGLVYIPEGACDPESELILLEELLISRFTRS